MKYQTSFHSVNKPNIPTKWVRCNVVVCTHKQVVRLHHNQLIRYRRDQQDYGVLCFASFTTAVGGRVSFDIKQCLDDSFIHGIELEICVFNRKYIYCSNKRISNLLVIMIIIYMSNESMTFPISKFTVRLWAWRESQIDIRYNVIIIIV